MNDNLINIIKTFRLSEDKYNTNEYYKLYVKNKVFNLGRKAKLSSYQMYISMLTALFDKELFDAKNIKYKGKNYSYNIINQELYDKHINVIKSCSTNKLFNINFID